MQMNEYLFDKYIRLWIIKKNLVVGFRQNQIIQKTNMIVFSSETISKIIIIVFSSQIIASFIIFISIRSWIPLRSISTHHSRTDLTRVSQLHVAHKSIANIAIACGSKQATVQLRYRNTSHGRTTKKKLRLL